MYIEYKVKIQDLVLQNLIVTALILASSFLFIGTSTSASVYMEFLFTKIYFSLACLVLSSLVISVLSWYCYVFYQNKTDKLTKTVKKSLNKMNRFSQEALKVAFFASALALLSYLLMVLQVRKAIFIYSFLGFMGAFVILTLLYSLRKKIEERKGLVITGKLIGLILIVVAFLNLIGGK